MTSAAWITVFLFIGLVCFVGIYAKRWVRSTADWLVAGRGCGRYLGATAGEASSLGAISIIAMLQAAYVGGPVAWWTSLIGVLIFLVISATGFGIYRLRETRVLTLNELLERRYSRKLRIFCGSLCFVSGLLNMGIFPAVAARFVVYFADLPLQFMVGSISVSTIPLVALLLVVLSVLLATMGGQISLLFTDFLQWMLMMLMFISIGFVVYRVVNWGDVETALLAAENPRAMVDPFLVSSANSFGLLFVFWLIIRSVYNVLSWAPSTTKSQSATEPKEAKIMWVFSYIRQMTTIGLLFAGVAGLACLSLTKFGEISGQVQTTVDSIANEAVRTEMVVPIFLSIILSPFMKGLFMAGMIAASISTLDTYFLTWAGVFTQDVASPLKKKEMPQQQRIKWLRWSVVGVAAFVYLFSILWKPTEYIFMYFAITATIYTGGAGAVILGGLYWRRGTTKGAWAAMIWGLLGSVVSIVCLQIYSDSGWWPGWLNGMSMAVLISLISIGVYVVVSLLTVAEKVDLEQLLHRPSKKEKRGLSERWRGIFSRDNIFELAVGGVAALLLFAILGTLVYSRFYEIPLGRWLSFWKGYAFLFYFLSIPITLWFLVGSIRDIVVLINRLNSEVVDEEDDGQI